MIHGWRPYSATNHPSSAAIQGSGRVHRQAQRNQRFSSRRTDAR